MKKATLCFLLISTMMFGCQSIEKTPQPIVSSTQSSQSQGKNQAYIPSAIHPEFPVPKQAQKTNHRSKNPNIKYIRYSFHSLMDLRKREQYFAEIQKWGWQEMEQEQMGTMHVFKKGEKRIHLTIHSDFFTIFTQK